MLAAVEQELAGEPVVFIGVHSPKFPTEGDEAMVREAVRRHGVTHPVVVDSRFELWNQYAVKAWPTLVIVGADGVIAGTAAGEPDREPLTAALRDLLDRQRPLLRDTRAEPLPLAPEPAPPGVLAYPGGLAVGDGALYVADTGHHQVVVCDPDGKERTRIGSGRPGLADGAGARATFDSPHGLAVDGPTLWVADTGNHAVRAVDLRSGQVTTRAGTGRRGRGLAAGGTARSTDLRSPWDVAVTPGGVGEGGSPGPRWAGKSVIIAMAGSHQLWILSGDESHVLAGFGAEARVDGAFASAAFAQPSGLAWGPDGALYVADSEISAIRRVAEGTVRTVCGGDLFDFGDIDGVGDEVRLQHPVGIGAGPDGTLLVADTLNHKIKTLDPTTGEVRTRYGNGIPFDAGLAALEERSPVPVDPRQALLREPEAVTWDGARRRVLIADTGNHRVLAVTRSTAAAGVSVLVGGRSGL